MNPLFLGYIKNRSLELYDLSRFEDYLSSLEGKEVRISVSTITKPRSDNQNRYYWGVVIKLLCDTTGYLDTEMHDALRMLFLRDMDKKIPTLRSTTSLSTKEFEDYLATIRMWAAQELNCIIPEPNEVALI